MMCKFLRNAKIIKVQYRNSSAEYQQIENFLLNAGYSGFRATIKKYPFFDCYPE
jgi:hypothetical protein